MLELENQNYSVLRNIQNQNIKNSFRQVMSMKTHGRDIGKNYHLQTSETMGARSQLVAEEGDRSEDMSKQLKLQVPLINMDDAIYEGIMYLGSPMSQPIRVIFDTGSEYLIVTSVLCDDKLAAKYRFKKLDAVTGQLKVQGHDDSKRCRTMAYDMQKSQSQKLLAHSSSKVVYGSAKI